MTEEFSAAEMAEAEQLDARITTLLAGRPDRGADPLTMWLATSLRPPLPEGVKTRVRDAVRRVIERAWLAVRLAAAVLAVLLTVHALGGLFADEWLARNLQEPRSPHVATEGGLALLGAAIAVAAGAAQRRWLPVSLLVGVPLGVAFGIGGIPELGHFAAGAALHLTEGTLALVLLALWWRARRYSRRRIREVGV